MEQLTTAQAAERLGCDPTHLRRLVREGKLAATALSPRVVLYDPAEIDRYARERRKPGRPHKKPAPAPEGEHDGR